MKQFTETYVSQQDSRSEQVLRLGDTVARALVSADIPSNVTVLKRSAGTRSGLWRPRQSRVGAQELATGWLLAQRSITAEPILDNDRTGLTTDLLDASGVIRSFFTVLPAIERDNNQQSITTDDVSEYDFFSVGNTVARYAPDVFQERVDRIQQGLVGLATAHDIDIVD